MKKIVFLFAIIVFGAITSFAQFDITAYNGKNLSNDNKPDAIIYRAKNDPDFSYYLVWEENYLKIQEVRHRNDPDSVAEYYLHYEDLAGSKILAVPESDSELKAINKTVYTITPKKPIPVIVYADIFYMQELKESVDIPFANDSEYQAFIAKIKDKALDLALLLDDAPERFTIEEVYINEKSGGSASTASNSEKETESSDSSSSSSNNSSSNNSSSNSTSNTTPKKKGKILVKIRNKTETTYAIEYTSSSTADGYETQTTIGARTTLRVQMPIGGKVYLKGKKTVLLVVTADMEDTEQVIFK